MAILERTISDKRRIDLAGPQGNAYVLLGIAENTSKKLVIQKKRLKRF